MDDLTNGGNGSGNSRGSAATQFKKGNTAAAGFGRPKDSGIRQLLGKIGKEHSAKDSDLTKLEYVCRKVWEQAAKGERWAIEILYDRMEGKPRQVIEMTNEDSDLGSLSDDQLAAYFLEQSRN